MARIRWVVATLREWAAWIDAPVTIRGIDYSETRVDRMAGNWLPADTFTIRRTQAAIEKLPAEYQETLCLVYIEGPRANKVSIDEIARWKGINKTTLYIRVCTAERKFAEELEKPCAHDVK